MSCNICACKGSAQSSCSIFSRSELIWQYCRTCCFGKGWGSIETPSKLFANHNTFRFSEGGPSSNPVLIESFVSGCNVNNVKINRAWEHVLVHPKSSTQKNQDFVKEHNRIPLNSGTMSRNAMRLGWNVPTMLVKPEIFYIVGMR